MTRLSITLLGPPQIAIDGVPVKMNTGRAYSLLAYLAITGQNQSRETLASLIWSDSSLSHSLAALRTTLWRLKAAGLDEWLIIDNNEISLNYQKPLEVDVLEFKQYLHKCTTHGHSPSQICLYCIPALTEAVDLYKGEFLAGFNLPRAQAFDDWRLEEGEALQVQFLGALERLVRGHRIFGDFNLAIQYARTLLRYDRFNEGAQYDLLQLYLVTGQRAAAINQYTRFKSALTRELGVQPSQELTNLYKQILSGQAAQASSQKVSTPVFLITQIEKSSLLSSQDDVYQKAFVARYDQIIKDTAKQFGGKFLQQSEQSVTILFENGQPLHWAVTVHLKIKKADWGPAGAPDLHMVLYSTFAEGEGRRDFSMITRAASNLLAISWSGQVLFTQQTLKVLDQPPGAKIKDLGFHRLKDHKDPVHIFEMQHPHLPSADHPPLQSGHPQLINFPQLTPAFIGRENELEELTTLLDFPDSRIISLVGPGGIGKTRLAIQFASQVVSRFPDGAYFISLASIQDPEYIPIVLADALKFSFYGPTSHAEQVTRYLHRLNALLVFDNFEHLRVEGARFLSMILNHTHYVKILVTTRERLNLLAERIIEVHGLPVPASELADDAVNYSAVKLFLYNAQRINPHFNLFRNQEAIIRICQLVNGLPLGIILASSWVRVYSCAQIAQEIARNIDFLVTTTPDLPPRHRSLRAVFDSSWKLLSDEEKVVLSRLSIFQNPFSAQAAQVICAASPQMLTSFLDKSLLNSQDERFYLVDTLCQYTTSILQAAENEFSRTRERYLSYYTVYCVQKYQELISSTQRQALEDLAMAYGDIRKAWIWMVESDRWDLVQKLMASLLTYHIMTTNYIRGREMFQFALNRLNALDDPSLEYTRLSLQQDAAWLTVRQGSISEGLNVLSTCLAAFRRLDASWEIIMVLMYIADASYMQGDYVQANSYIQEALHLLRAGTFSNASEVDAITANCQYILGLTLIDFGELEQAKNYMQVSLSTHQRLGTYWGSLKPLLGLGKLAVKRGDYLECKDIYQQALEIATRLSDRRSIGVIHNNLGSIYQDLANPTQSYHHMTIALQLVRETGDRRLTAVILNNIAFILLRYFERPAEAIRIYQESIELFTDNGDLRGTAFTYYDISKAYIAVGLIDEARDYCSQALNTAMTLDSIPLILHALHGFANLYAHIGEPARALELCYQIEHHPQVEEDTKKRLIVTRVQLEADHPDLTHDDNRTWNISASLQDIIDQVLNIN